MEYNANITDTKMLSTRCFYDDFGFKPIIYFMLYGKNHIFYKNLQRTDG